MSDSGSAPAAERPKARAAPEGSTAPARPAPPPRPMVPLPYLLDFFPLQEADQTGIARFFARLREGRLSTTRCSRDDLLHWPPRVACPKCHGTELTWVDLPERGRIYASSAVLAGAPLGMEADVPFAVGLVDLDGVPLRLFGRIVGRRWEALAIGLPVRVEGFELADGRVFYRFRAEPEPGPPGG